VFDATYSALNGDSLLGDLKVWLAIHGDGKIRDIGGNGVCSIVVRFDGNSPVVVGGWNTTTDSSGQVIVRILNIPSRDAQGQCVGLEEKGHPIVIKTTPKGFTVQAEGQSLGKQAAQAIVVPCGCP